MAVAECILQIRHKQVLRMLLVLIVAYFMCTVGRPIFIEVYLLNVLLEYINLWPFLYRCWIVVV